MVGCDVVVIGGGMAGVSVAYELAASRSVVLVEAEKALATHSTGRSAAAYLPSYGPPAVRALTVASHRRFTELNERYGTGPKGPLTPRPMLWLAVDDESDHEARLLIAERAAGQGSLAVLDAAAALELVSFARAESVRFAALDAAADDIDVAMVHQCYVRGLRERGGVIHVGAPVAAVDRTSGGWQVTAGAQRFETPLVVNAAGAWADRVALMAGVAPVGLQPRRRTLFTAPVAADSGLRGDAPLVCDPCERWYFKPEGGGILASPADADPVEPGDAKASEEGIARAIEGINAATRLRVRTVRRSWGGLRTFAPDGLPVVGFRAEHPGFGFVAGQGGYGIQMAPALASFAAAVLTGGEVPADIALPVAALTPDRFGA